MTTICSWKWVLRIGLLCASTLTLGQAQIQTPVGDSGNQRVALPILYRHFLAYLNHLDRTGAALDAKGEKGSGFRDHFQKKLGFSNEEFAPVRAAAQRLEATLKAHDAKIRAVIDRARAQNPNKLPQGTPLPSVPEELRQLQAERDTIIQSEFERLNSDLGPENAEKLRAVIESDFAPNVRVQTIHPMPAHDPAHTSLPPFPTEVR